MATRVDIIPALAKLFDTLPNSVDVIDRELAAAGLRARLPRGRGAGAVSALDLTHLAFALTGRRAVRGAAQEVDEISSLPLTGGRCLREEMVREYPDPVFVDELAALTPKGILEGTWSQRYPRDLLPMASTFGQSVAGIIERLPDLESRPASEGVFLLEATVSWEPITARIEFRHGIYMFIVDFGGPRTLREDRPQFTFRYTQTFLGRLTSIFKA
ncbi:hypothetical protein [Nioella nitratireducens]|uniref:hypothetical protein n=1 Tax=Nioella nitratireducens TaxID=1287720 RepID=UPI0008FD04C5|nr:hypothetical protein [Nioella nitratireducens]